MSLQAHLEVLQTKHAKLEEQIQQAFQSHASDFEVASLKKQKLLLKEEIEQTLIQMGGLKAA